LTSNFYFSFNFIFLLFWFHTKFENSSKNITINLVLKSSRLKTAVVRDIFRRRH